MPFTLGGDWIESPKPQNNKPIKVHKCKRGRSIITVISNLKLTEQECKDLCAKIKKKLGCGGSVKNETIEIQGEQIDKVKEILIEQNILKRK